MQWGGGAQRGRGSRASPGSSPPGNLYLCGSRFCQYFGEQVRVEATPTCASPYPWRLAYLTGTLGPAGELQSFSFVWTPDYPAPPQPPSPAPPSPIPVATSDPAPPSPPGTNSTDLVAPSGSSTTSDSSPPTPPPAPAPSPTPEDQPTAVVDLTVNADANGAQGRLTGAIDAATGASGTIVTLKSQV
jgi:hypothetical protein